MSKLNKVIELIDACKGYTPLDGRVLVYAHKLRTKRQVEPGLELADTKANAGKDPSIHRVDLKQVHPKINCKYQSAIVLQVPFDENRFKVGDTVVYPIGAINEFDFVKGVSVLRKYDIAAVYNGSVIEVDTTPIDGYNI